MTTRGGGRRRSDASGHQRPVHGGARSAPSPAPSPCPDAPPAERSRGGRCGRRWRRAPRDAAVRKARLEAARRARARKAGRAEPVVAEGVDWTPEEACSATYLNQMDLDASGVRNIARTPEAYAELLEFRASHQRLQRLRPASVAILSFLAMGGVPAQAASQGEGWASPGVEVGVAGWGELLGFSRRALHYGMAQCLEEGLIARYEHLVTVTHLTRHRPPDEQCDAWRDARDRVHDRVQLYSRTYLTPAGAELLQGLGFDVGGRGAERGTRGWRRAGWLGRVSRLVGPLWRSVHRRLSALWTTTTAPAPESRTAPVAGIAADPSCTPFTTLLSSDSPREVGVSLWASAPPVGAVSRPMGATMSGEAAARAGLVAVSGKSPRVEGAFRASMGGALPCTSAVPPPLATEARLAAWHGLTADGLHDGLSWEGGWLPDFAELVGRCWTRAVKVEETPPDWAGAELEPTEALRPPRCLGCGAFPPGRPGKGGWGVRRHGPGCPTHRRERLPAGDFRWAPALTARECWWRAWTLRPEDRPMLERLFEPVRRELERRLAAFSAAAAEPGVPAAPERAWSEWASPTLRPRTSLAEDIARRRAELEAMPYRRV
jgi:hypothetical protein